MQIGSKVTLKTPINMEVAFLIMLHGGQLPNIGDILTVKEIVPWRCDHCDTEHINILVEEMTIYVESTGRDGGMPDYMYVEVQSAMESVDSILNKILSTQPKELVPELV